jgi:hypothetical protein
MFVSRKARQRKRALLPVLPLAAVVGCSLSLVVVAQSSGAAARQPVAARAGDQAVYGTGDITGYHLFTASAAGRWAWHALATIQPGGYEDERWIGQQCLTGDGRTVVAVIAPWSANNSEAGMDAGALAYVVDVRTGAVRPVASGVSLAYFDPGCGADGSVTLTSYLGSGQRPTRLSVFSAASGRLEEASTVRAEVTSAVEVRGRILAAEGGSLVDVTRGSPAVLHRFGGQLADLRPGAGGSVDFTVQGRKGTGQVWSYSPSTRAQRLGSGKLAAAGLLAGAQGHNIVANVDMANADMTNASVGVASGTTVLQLPGALLPESASSRGGLVLVEDTHAPLGAARAGDPYVAEWLQGSASVTRARLPRPATRRVDTLPAFSAATGRTLAPASASVSVRAARGASIVEAEDSVPQCAVPRNDIFKQVWQPGADQVRWAVNQAAMNALGPASGAVARPPDNQEYTVDDSSYTALPGLYPSQQWELVNMTGSDPAVTVPPLVMYGILAQESNWDQASWHAAPGRSGNPLVADYYGVTNLNNPTGALDYNYADCGYGIGQVTTGMQSAAYESTQSAPQPTLPAATQTTLAVDYAANIAYAEYLLQGKWYQLQDLGITMNDNDPTKVENWYGAIWAYNSGVHTGAKGYNGLGWFNNPANPMYPYPRHAFLHDGNTPTTGDAADPQWWPYQEKVFGWMEVPLTVGGVLDYRGTYDWDRGTGTFLSTPSPAVFCDPALNHCDPNAVGVPAPCPTGDNPNCHADPCPNEDNTCYWDAPASWAPGNCDANCVTDTPWEAPNGHEYYDTPGLPEPVDAPQSAACSLGASTPVTDASGNLLPGTVIVDDEMIVSQNPGQRTPNLMGCPDTNSALVPPASANASFFLLGPGHDAIDAAADPGDPAAIDLHQLGGGLGGHMFFTHTTSDTSAEVAGEWSTDLPANATTGTAYQIYAFVPDVGAATDHATYRISAGGANGGPLLQRTINQGNYSNQWASLGYYLCGSKNGPASCTMSVTLSSLTPSDDPDQGADIAMDAVAFVPVPTGGYVALGDSYSSGEGLEGGWDDGTDVSHNLPGDNGNNCHRAAGSYPRLYAAAKGIPVVELACSGSNLWDLAGINYWVHRDPSSGLMIGDGKVVYNPDDPYASPGDGWTSSESSPNKGGSSYYYEQAPQTDLVRALAPRLVTPTIGGNDLGIGDIVHDCMYNALNPLVPTGTFCRNDYVDHDDPTGPDQIDNRLSSLQAPVTAALYNVIAAVGDPAKVVLITYPAPIKYDAGESGYVVSCDMYNYDLEWLVPKVGEMDDMLIAAARAASLEYDPDGSETIKVVDERYAFSGHEGCTSDSYITTPDPGITLLPFWPWSPNMNRMGNYYHPDAEGYQKLEQDLAAAVPNP